MKTLLILFFCASAVASENSLPSQFAGSWSGTGVYRREGTQTFCTQFKMSFNGTESKMSFGGGERVCERHSEVFQAVDMDFKDGKLLFFGQDVGSIKGNLLESHFSMDEGNGHVRHWRMSMRREGNTIIYEESRTMDNETTPLISFAGLLTLEK